MKTRGKFNSLLVIVNLIVLVLFLFPTRTLNLFDENYSTLSLTTRGYLYVLFLGSTIGLLLWCEANLVFQSKRNILFFITMLIGVIIPHHVPYNLQGNLHLICAYAGFVGLVIMTLLNCQIKKYRDIYILFIFISILIYLKFGMVNTLSEIVVMIGTLYTNLLVVINKRIK